MKGSLSLGTYAGIKVRVHWTFIILPIIIIASDVLAGRSFEGTLWSLAFLITIFLCVILHEFGHALVAKKFNYKTRDITLLPIGGIARLESMPDNPKQELLVAIAGPIVNFVIASFIFIFSAYDYPLTEALSDTATLGAENFLFFLMLVNLFIGLFNLTPAFPMDGGRILRALLSFKLPRHKATLIAARLGQFIAFGFLLLGLFYNVFLMIIAIFVYLGAQAEYQMEQSKFLIGDHRVGEMIIEKYEQLNADDPLSTAVDALLKTTSTNFLIMRDGTLAGTISRARILDALKRFDEETPLDKVMNKDIKTVHPEMRVSELYSLRKGNGTDLSVMPVIDNGKLLGVIDLENIVEFILTEQAKNEHRQTLHSV